MIRVLLNGTAYPENYLSWQERKETISRSELFKGVIITQSLELQFIRDAYDYIIQLEKSDDIAAECTIEIQYYDQIDEWVTGFDGFLDFKTLKKDTKDIKKCTISAYDSGFANKLLERVEMEIPYDRTTSLDGNPITTIMDNGYQTVNINGIEVVGDDVPSIFDENKHTDDDGSARNLILGISTESNSTRFQQIATRAYGGSRNPNGITITDCYYLADTDTTLTFDFTLYYKFSSDLTTFPNDWENYIRVYKATFDDDNALDSLEILGEVYNDTNRNTVYSDSFVVNLLENEGIVFYVYHWAQNILTNQDSYFQVKENSVITTDYSALAPPTSCEFVPPHEAFSRIVESITNESDPIYAPIFGRTDIDYDEDGEGALLFLTNGKLIRRFPRYYEIEKAAQLSFKLKELFENVNKIIPIGAGVQEGKLYIDKLENFYLTNVLTTIEIDDMEIDSFEKSIDLTMYKNEIEVGSTYEQPEEVSGLEEYNSVQKYGTPVLHENKYDLLNTYIYAAYPFEFARRKQFDAQETEDYRYDNNNFIFKAYRTESGFVQHSAQDFVTITGLDNISNYINLDITPKRNLLRHGWILNTGFKGYQTGKLTYNKSDIVTDLVTQKNDEPDPISECADVNITDLDSPKFTGRIVKFNAPVSFELFNQLKENPYYLIEYYDPTLEEYGYGWIKEVSSSIIDKTTNWELYETTGFSEEGSYRLLQDGSRRLLETGDYRLLE